MTTNYPKPYLVGKIYYFKYTDRTGTRFKKSTGYKRKVDAQKFIHSFIGRLQAGVNPDITLRVMLKLYQDPETNPKRNQATVTATNYSERYAKHTARHAKDLEIILDKRVKKLLDKPMCDVIRLELKDVAVLMLRSMVFVIKV